MGSKGRMNVFANKREREREQNGKSKKRKISMRKATIRTTTNQLRENKPSYGQ